jgi:hypothetical protein
MPFHRFDDRFKRLVFGDRAWIGSHNLFDFPTRTVRIFLRELAGPHDKFKPLWPLPLSTQLAPAQKITLGNDPD